MRTLLLSVLLVLATQAKATNRLQGEKILQVTITESGIITVGRDTVDSENLARYIQERLFKSYLGTGRMYDRIILSQQTESTPDMVTDVVIREIRQGQQRALTQVSLQKYRNTFDKLDDKKKSKLKKMFPILFQELISQNAAR